MTYTQRFELRDRAGRVFVVEVAADMTALANLLGRDALANKSRKAKLGAGAIICQVIEERKG